MQKLRLSKTLKAVLGAQSAVAAIPRRGEKKKKKLSELRFIEYDADGAQPLDFEEFYAAMPARIREQRDVATIRAWFDAADAAAGTRSDGEVSINDFTSWTLFSRVAAELGAASLEDAFRAFDSKPSYLGRDGLLDLDEFTAVCNVRGQRRAPNHPARSYPLEP